jgi:hypothetical protein
MVSGIGKEKIDITAQSFNFPQKEIDYTLEELNVIAVRL